MPVRTARRQVVQNGRRLSFTDASHGEAASVIVFLHAFPLHSGMWAPQLGDLPAGWRALAPDFRGFGASDSDTDPSGAGSTLDDYAGDIVRLLDDLGVERALFCGLSMGGYTLFTVLRRWVDRVSGIVLADTRATADTGKGIASRLAMLDKLDLEGPPAIASEMLPGLLGETTKRERPAIVQAVSTMVLGAGESGIRHAIRRMMNRPDSVPQLGTITCPALVIVGEEDTLTPARESVALAEGIPAASMAVIPGAGHLSNLERPDAFNAALWWFLASFGVLRG